jgi:hypothetical protein
MGSHKEAAAAAVVVVEDAVLLLQNFAVNTAHSTTH